MIEGFKKILDVENGVELLYGCGTRPIVLTR